MKKNYEEGNVIEDFNLPVLIPSGEEKLLSIKEIAKGKYLILYFYPKDNTSGCTTEAKDFSNVYKDMQKNFVICGVSPDSIESHKRFKTKHNLNIYLLSDKEKKIMELFGAYGEKNMYGKIRMGVIRSTFLIDKDLKIIKSWRNVRAKGHADKVIDWIKNNLKEEL